MKTSGSPPDTPVVLSARYRFGGLVLDMGRRRLTAGRRTIALGRLTFDLLRALVEAAPNALSHAQLARRVWGERPVSPQTLSQRVKLLRDALSDDALDPQYVKVIRGHGYRLIPPVRILPASSGWLRVAPRPFARGVLAGLGALAAVGIWLAAVPGERAARATIAVVPFAPAPGLAAGQMRFGEELAEAVIRRLARLRAVRALPSAASFPLQDGVAQAHATESGLGVSHMLRGAIRQADDSISVHARLIDCATGYQVWSGSIELGAMDPEAALEAVAAYVVGELEIALTHSPTILAGETGRLPG